MEILDKIEYILCTDERCYNCSLSIEFEKIEEEPYTHIFNTTQVSRLYLYHYTIRVLQILAYFPVYSSCFYMIHISCFTKNPH